MYIASSTPSSLYGIPDHATGTFPNSGNPNTISEQHHHYRVPLHPLKTGAITPLGMNPFGVAVNGIPFDPGAAEYWNQDPQSCWQYEALSEYVTLGMDSNHAHVQPSGAYHYHGVPTGLLQTSGRDTATPLVGYAADGFPIYAMPDARSSYRVKSGTRPSGPGGDYDGRFIQDYEYAASSGDLDPCNGRAGVTPEFPGGTYYYVITTSFPFIPRCFVGAPDASFARTGAPPSSPRTGPPGAPPPALHRGPPPDRPPPHLHGPPPR